VVLGPRLLGVLQLPGDAVPPDVGSTPPEPVVEHPRLELEPDPEPDRLVVHPGDQGQAVVPPHEPPLEEVDLPLGRKIALYTSTACGSSFSSAI
jgi:hypothetical protein